MDVRGNLSTEHKATNKRGRVDVVKEENDIGRFRERCVSSSITVVSMLLLGRTFRPCFKDIHNEAAPILFLDRAILASLRFLSEL